MLRLYLSQPDIKMIKFTTKGANIMESTDGVGVSNQDIPPPKIKREVYFLK